jgi:3-oxoadipate enol-lactonase
MTHQLTITQHILERDGCTFHYWLAGPEDRPLVVLTHGATMDYRMFVAQVEMLAPHYRALLEFLGS